MSEIPVFILSLMTKEREEFVQNNLKNFPNFNVVKAINGLNKEEVFSEFQKLGVRYTRLKNDPIHGHFNTFGMMANYISKINIINECIEKNYKYFAILEDDLLLNPIFYRFIKIATKAQLENSLVENWFIRLGEWGEGYIFDKDGAIKTIEKIKGVGIRTQFDFELKYNGYPHIACNNTPWKLLVPTNEGDILKTSMISDDEADKFMGLC